MNIISQRDARTYVRANTVQLGVSAPLGVFPIIGFSYTEASFDLEFVSPISLCIIREIHRAISSEIFGPPAVTFTNSHGKSRLTRYWRLEIT